MSRRFEITPPQWSRFVESAMPSLAELLAVGVLNAAAAEVELVGGNRKDDLRCRVGEVSCTIEVKTAWWHDDEHTVVGHSPLRAHQSPDLVALVGRFDVDESAPTLQAIDSAGLTIDPDRMFYLVPSSVVREHSVADGKSTARALMPIEMVQRFQIDLIHGISEKELRNLVAEA